MRHCHSVRGHPEVTINGSYGFGSIHKWEKRKINKAIRRYYKSGYNGYFRKSPLEQIEQEIKEGWWSPA